MINVRRLAERPRSVGKGRTARQPEHGQHRRQPEIGQRQFALVVIQIVGVRINDSDEQTVEHRQDAGGHEKLGAGRNVDGNGDGAGGRGTIVYPAHIEFVRKRIVNIVCVGFRRSAADRRHLYRYVDGGGEGENREDLCTEARERERERKQL